jgi:ribonucleoside-diphosphate reductase alpha chain
VAPALHRLGYPDEKIQQIIEYVIGTTSLHRAPHINSATLIAKGFTAADIDKMESVLPGVFEIGFAFNQWTLGEEAMQRLGFTPEQYNGPGFNMLAELGFTDEQISDANDYVCGHQTIEGAPGLRDDHLAVFDTANRNGKYGVRYIHYTGHINMMAAAQPFISGAISKTINMPNDVTVDDIEDAYRLSWELGLKSMALYRDGSKASQPLSVSSDGETTEDEPPELDDAVNREVMINAGMFQPGTSPTQAYHDLPRPRFLLPGRRRGFTQEARVGGHKVFLRTGEYDDGTLGELFIDLAKEGATLRGILSCFAIAVSKGLQYGVPLEEFVDTFTFQTFEPRGFVEGHPNIKMANSLIDYVFRAVGLEYLHRDELVQVPPDRSRELPEPPKGIAVEMGTQLDLTDAAMEADIDAQVRAAEFADGPASLPVTENRPGTAAPGTVAAPPAVSNRPGTMAAAAPGSAATAAVIAAESSLGDLMGDAAACQSCGHMTVRNGSCYVCLTCGDTTGCS